MLLLEIIASYSSEIQVFCAESFFTRPTDKILYFSKPDCIEYTNMKGSLA